jgi:hypothetical protein
MARAIMSGYLWKVAIIGVSIVCFAPVGRAQGILAAGECEMLKKVVVHTENDFILLKASQLEGDKWGVSLALPGSRSCYIQRSMRISYVCESRMFSSRPDALRFRDQRLDAIQECLGPVWTKQLMFAEFFVGVSDPDAERSIILAVERDGPYDRYFLRTDVQRMNQLPLEAAPQSPAKVRPDGYCGTLKEVLADSRAKFARSIEGAERHEFPSNVHWESKKQLPGWRDCFVNEWNGQEACRYLSCKTDVVAYQAQASALMESVSSDIRKCLGSEWRENNIRQLNGIARTRIESRSNPVIELQPSKSLFSEAWHLEFRVGMEAACLTKR